MRFIIDAQLPPALARWLSERGHDAEHAADEHLEAASDSVIWDRAMATSAVIVSKDEDFAQRKARVDGGPVVVWVRLPNTRRRELLVWFEDVLPELVSAIERGETLVELV